MVITYLKEHPPQVFKLSKRITTFACPVKADADTTRGMWSTVAAVTVCIV